MRSTRSEVFLLLGSLVGSLILLGLGSCSLETSDLSTAAFTKRTFVRVHGKADEIERARRVALASVQPRGMVEPEKASGSSAVVKIPTRNDFKRYAVAYAQPMAVVQDQSVIPFALRSQAKPLKRLELSFLKRRAKVSEPPKAPAPRPQAPPRLRVRTTAYTHNERDHLKYGRRSALGTRLRFGTVRSAAADWSRYPVGTQFRIVGQPGVLYEVDDYGGALVGTGTIDLYKPTFSAMNRWGVRHVEIEVTKWGSFERSLEVLSPRTKWSHVRRMVHSIRAKGPDVQLAALTLAATGDAQGQKSAQSVPQG